MGLSLIQYRNSTGQRSVAAWDGSGRATRVKNAASVYELANKAISHGISLDRAVRDHGRGEDVDLASLVQEERLLAPIDHAEPARLYLTGTGLTHLGSAETRDAMHRAASDDSAQTDSMQTDSLRLFLMGLKGGKPVNGVPGVQPEWFYKGNGACVARPGGSIMSPPFARDAGEEAEIAGVYLIAPNGNPMRLGFCLANEFSDHVTERENYLWLAHSKLRQAAFGPELLTGPLPEHVRGASRILRNGAVIWKNRSSPAKRICRTAFITLSSTTSSTPFFAAREMSTFISLAPRPSPLPMESARNPAMSSRLRPNPSTFSCKMSLPLAMLKNFAFARSE